MRFSAVAAMQHSLTSLHPIALLTAACILPIGDRKSAQGPRIRLIHAA
jgi:hypothetical protein